MTVINVLLRHGGALLTVADYENDYEPCQKRKTNNNTRNDARQIPTILSQSIFLADLVAVPGAVPPVLTTVPCSATVRAVINLWYRTEYSRACRYLPFDDTRVTGKMGPLCPQCP